MTGEDLSQDTNELNGANSNIALTGNNGEDVSLTKQNYDHRNYVFYATIIICVVLYFLFCLFVFCPDGLRSLLIHTPYVVAIGVALLVVPSALLWGIIRSVFGVKDDDKNSDGLAKDLAGFIKHIIKIYPASH